MYLRTMTSLACEDKETIIHEEEYIKVYLDNGEVFTGIYAFSNNDYLMINMYGDIDTFIYFYEINKIEVIK